MEDKWSDFHGDFKRYFMCDECGRRLLRKKDMFGNWDGETYYCPNCDGNDDFDEMEECCSACGNPAYPNCKSSCDLFDD